MPEYTKRPQWKIVLQDRTGRRPAIPAVMTRPKLGCCLRWTGVVGSMAGNWIRNFADGHITGHFAFFKHRTDAARFTFCAQISKRLRYDGNTSLKVADPAVLRYRSDEFRKNFTGKNIRRVTKIDATPVPVRNTQPMKITRKLMCPERESASKTDNEKTALAR